MEMIVETSVSMDITDVDGELAAACGRISKLKRKRSSEQLMLRKTVKPKVFLQDLHDSTANGSSSNDAMWSSNVCDVNMNISDELSKMLTSKCMIEKGRWMIPQQCMIGKANYKFAVIGYSYDLSDGGCIENTGSGQSMCDNPIANGIDRHSIEVIKTDNIEMIQSNDTQMVLENNHTQQCSARNLSKCVKKLFGEPNAQHDIRDNCPNQRYSESNQMENWFNEFWSDDSKFTSPENCGKIATQRSLSMDHLNGNVSYSYRTHFFLNP